jgi:hypothetical protein
MVMLLLKRGNVPLDRDVIFLAESGEEGATGTGIEFVIRDHFSAIDAEFCYAEGGGVTREKGSVRYAQIQTTEKVPNGIDLVARGVAGHGSVPLQTNAIAHLSKAVAAVAEWQPAINLNDTTAQYFKRLAGISPPEQARHYRNVVSGNSKLMAESDAWLRANEPRHASMLRTSVSRNIIQSGYRINVIRRGYSRSTSHMIPDESPGGSGAAQGGGQRSVDRRRVQRLAADAHRQVAQRRHVAHRLRGLQGGRGRHHEALSDDHAADDEHRRVRHGVPAREGHAVLRHRAGRRHRGRTQGLRRAQRSGADPRSGAKSLRPLSRDIV